MNTSAHIPFDCVSPNVIVLKEYRESPGLQGTGFFCYFSPYKPIFYVTARHCVEGLLNEDSDSLLMIPYSADSDRAVDFYCTLEPEIEEGDEANTEDIAIFVTNPNISDDDHSTLLKRALKLKHQDDVDSFFKLGLKTDTKLRTVGYPHHNHPNCQTTVDYSKNQIRYQPRGFHGVLFDDGMFDNQFVLNEVNWKEGEYRGFSGSPILALIDSITEVTAIPVGVVVMASLDKARFININVATNLIASYLVDQIDKGLIEEIPEIAPGQGAF